MCFNLGLATFPSTCLILCAPLASMDLQCTAAALQVALTTLRHAACIARGVQKGMGPVRQTLSLRLAVSLTALNVVEPTMTARHAPGWAQQLNELQPASKDRCM